MKIKRFWVVARQDVDAVRSLGLLYTSCKPFIASQHDSAEAARKAVGRFGGQGAVVVDRDRQCVLRG